MTTPPPADAVPVRRAARPAHERAGVGAGREVGLYAVYLGGNLARGRMGEDHEVIHVVAPDVASARRLAKQKWQGSGPAHVDAVLHLDVVDGYAVALEPSERHAVAVVDNTYDPE
jgi:hypothetical protein